MNDHFRKKQINSLVAVSRREINRPGINLTKLQDRQDLFEKWHCCKRKDAASWRAELALCVHDGCRYQQGFLPRNREFEGSKFFSGTVGVDICTGLLTGQFAQGTEKSSPTVAPGHLIPDPSIRCTF